MSPHRPDSGSDQAAGGGGAGGQPERDDDDDDESAVGGDGKLICVPVWSCSAMPKIFSASYTKALKFLDNPEIVRPDPPFLIRSATPSSSPTWISHSPSLCLLRSDDQNDIMIPQQPPSFQVSLSQEYHMKGGSMVKTTDSKVTFLRDPQTKLITR